MASGLYQDGWRERPGAQGAGGRDQSVTGVGREQEAGEGEDKEKGVEACQGQRMMGVKVTEGVYGKTGVREAGDGPKDGGGR